MVVAGQFALWSGPALAADPVSAEARLLSDAGAADRTAEVAVEVSIQEGWHINSDKPGLEFLIPTGVEFELPDGATVESVTYPEPVIRTLQFGGDKELSLFEGEFSIRARIASADADDIVVKLRYQACNDTVCLRPKTVTLDLAAEPSAGRPGSGVEFLAAGAKHGAATGTPALKWDRFTNELWLAALREDAPFVMGFTAEWCLPCKEMSERTFTDASVIDAAEGVRLFEVDTTTTTDYIARVMESFDVKAMPTTLFFDSEGREFTRRGGYIPAPEFKKLLDDLKRAGASDPASSPSAI